MERVYVCFLVQIHGVKSHCTQNMQGCRGFCPLFWNELLFPTSIWSLSPLYAEIVIQFILNLPNLKRFQTDERTNRKANERISLCASYYLCMHTAYIKIRAMPKIPVVSYHTRIIVCQILRSL